jgi:hypothetical protein
MTTDFDFPNKYLVGPVVFRPAFNEHNEPTEAISATQAWSLFFTAGQEDKALGLNAQAGQFFTSLLVAGIVAGTLWTLLFTTVA